MRQFPSEKEVKAEKQRLARIEALSKLGPTERLKTLRREERLSVKEEGVRIEKEILETIQGKAELARYKEELEVHTLIRGNTAHRLTIVGRHEIAMSRLKRLHESGELTKEEEGEEEEENEDEDED